mmetsp:Transcript_92671/g.258122  ORF Transcript_92671/g.258122 Transcript_92671/m.258122 type:complete len:243 (-) Transcript_92671:254-982(-)
MHPGHAVRSLGAAAADLQQREVAPARSVGDLSVLLQHLTGVAQCRGVFPNRCEHQLPLAPQLLRGVPQREAVLLNRGFDDAAVRPQLLTGMAQRQAIFTHSSEHDPPVLTKVLPSIAQGLRIQLNSSEDKLPVGLQLPRYALQSSVLLPDHLERRVQLLGGHHLPVSTRGVRDKTLQLRREMLAVGLQEAIRLPVPRQGPVDPVQQLLHGQAGGHRLGLALLAPFRVPRVADGPEVPHEVAS